jgi:hypothetical protein
MKNAEKKKEVKTKWQKKKKLQSLMPTAFVSLVFATSSLMLLVTLAVTFPSVLRAQFRHSGLFT